MNRLVSQLLIPLLMLGHVLPHSHAGTCVVEPNGHSLRAHIHVSGTHHHTHDDGGHHHHHHAEHSATDPSEMAETDTLSVSTEHDSDAIYFVDSESTATRTVEAPELDFAVLVWTSIAPSVDHEACKASRLGSPPDRYAGLPVYLLTASLRL